MIIGGLQKISLVDYPGRSAAVIFTQGCNMRCGYCHNPELVLPERYCDTVPLEDVMGFLERRRGKLDAVVISGGEPTMQSDLAEFAHNIKEMGFLVKIDSNGTNPDVLKKIIDAKDVDFIAMDIKAPLLKYFAVTARPVDCAAIARSVRLIMSSGLQHEFRTTVVKGTLDIEDFEQIGAFIKGSMRFAVQKFSPAKTLNPNFARKFAYSDDEMQQIKSILEKYVKFCTIH